MGTGLVLITTVACSAERYARPDGPAPRYEVAPVAPWDAGAPAARDSLAAPFHVAEAAGPRVDAGRGEGATQGTGSHERVQEN